MANAHLLDSGRMDNAGSPPECLATPTPHRLPDSVGSSAVALANPEVKAVSPFKLFVPPIRAHPHPHLRPRLELKPQA
ncbi:hypothetical protein K438DRAFT_1971005 [Mycena galopus ATCC 62051]|nr:hypothetical protein K438DRAFT_1971005 [Mycena galopus ATCC 62051]